MDDSTQNFCENVGELAGKGLVTGAFEINSALLVIKLPPTSQLLSNRSKLVFFSAYLTISDPYQWRFTEFKVHWDISSYIKMS